jgi:hypothetical protein
MERATTSRRALLRAASTAVAYATGAAIVGTGMALAGEVHGETLAAPAVSTAKWDAAMARFQQADAAFEAVKHDDVLSDDALDHYSECQWKAMETPAPHMKALKWKLDYLLEGERSTASWGAEYVRPVLDDIARFAAQEG